MPGRSWSFLDAFTSDHGRRSSDGDLLAVEVNVLPPQVEQLAAACSGVGRDVKEAMIRCCCAVARSARSWSRRRA